MNKSYSSSSGFNVSDSQTKSSVIITDQQSQSQFTPENLKEKRFKNLIELEQDCNAGTLQALNGLQDVEINELITQVDQFLNQSFEKINRNDNLLNVSFNYKSFNSNVNNGELNPMYKKYKSANQLKNSANQANNHEKQDELIEDKREIISISSLQVMDFLRNGIRSGPLLCQIDNLSALFPKLIKEETSSAAPSTNKKEIKPNLKFLLPKSDIEQISLNMPTNINPTSTNNNQRIFSSMSRNKRVSSSVNPSRTSTFTVSQFLNSKALLDRLFKYFFYVFKYEWHNTNMENKSKFDAATQEKQQTKPQQPDEQVLPQQQQQQQNVIKNSNNKPRNDQKDAPKEPILNEFKHCELSNNRLKFSFKWQGSKYKDLDVNILINFGIKYDNQLIKDIVEQSIVQICNEFFHKNGFCKKLRPLDSQRMRELTNWLSQNIKLNLNQVHLVPNYIHYWTLNFECLKFDLLKFLIWTNSLTETSYEANELNVLINEGLYKLNETKLSKPLGIPYNNFFYSIATNQNSTLMLLCKVLQICFHLSYYMLETSKLKEESANNDEEFLIDIMLNEIKFNRKFMYDLNDDDCSWNSLSLFEHVWSSLLRMRDCISTCYLSDTLNIYENVVPKMILKYNGYYGFQFPISDSFEDSQSSKINPNVTVLKGFILSIENAMRLVFTNVVRDELFEEDSTLEQETEEETLENSSHLHESLQFAIQKSKSHHKKKHNAVESVKSTLGSSIRTNLTSLSKNEN